MINRITTVIIVTLFISFGATAQNSKAAKDYLSIAGPISFAGKVYNLSWSSHPSDNFYKHEYLVKGDLPDKYSTMLMIDVIISNEKLGSIVATKINELKNMQANNPLVQYNSFQKSGEYLLDFLVSANNADGKKLAIVERNVYRYKTFTDKSGKAGILLFGVSSRSYDNNIDNFLKSLKINKNDLLNQVGKFTIPPVTIAQ